MGESAHQTSICRPGWIAIALAALLVAPASAQPARVLSLNLCTDQLLLALAAPGQIAAVTLLARDCAISAACEAAARVKAVRGTAEEVLALSPDLILAGRFGAGPAIEAAKRLRIPVLTIADATSLPGIRANISDIAGALGRAAEGQALLSAFDLRLAAIPRPETRRVAAVYHPNGYTAGPSSLANAVLRRAGLDNYAVQHGLSVSGNLPLEHLLQFPPDMLVVGASASGYSLAQAMVQHPALRRGFAGRIVEVPGRDWICGSPATLDAVEILARAQLRAQ